MVLPMSWGHSSSMGLRALKSKKGFCVSWMSVRLETGPMSILVCGQTQAATTEFPLPHSLPQARSGLDGLAECRKPGSSQGWVGMAGGSSLGLGKALLIVSAVPHSACKENPPHWNCDGFPHVPSLCSWGPDTSSRRRK